MRRVLLVIALGACAPEATLAVDLSQASVRVPYQTDPRQVLVFETDIEQPYEALGDLQVTLRQRSTLGQMPTRDLAIRELQQQAARIGAHAIIHVSFGNLGMSWWSYNELQGHGRAVRFR
jgi:hypothetical protein